MVTTPKRSPLVILALAVVLSANAAAVILSAMGLTENVFWLRFRGYRDGAIFVSDFIRNMLLYWPLTIPISLWLLRRCAIELPRFWLRAGVAIGLLHVFLFIPVAQIDLAQGPEWSDLFRAGIIVGVSRPAAMLIVIATLLVMAPARGPLWIERPISIIAALFAIYGLRLLIEGAALPQLEDEVAYWLQALLLRSGRLIGHAPAPAGITAERWDEITLLPYIMRDGDQFFSAHQHGWSYLLAFFDTVGAAGVANVLLALLSVWLCWIAVARLFPDSARAWRWLAPAALAAMPAHFFGSGNLMAHMSALCLEMIALLCWFRFQGARKHRESILSLFAFVFVLAGLFFVRPQSGLAFCGGLIAAELLGAFLPGGSSSHRQPILWRLSALFIALISALVALQLYAGLLPGGRIFLTGMFLDAHFSAGCQLPFFGPDYGCVPTYGSIGHSFRKLLMNLIEVLQSLSLDLSLFGLPALSLLAVLAALQWRGLFTPPAMTLSLALFSHVLVYGAYWHNGGESYRGRYLLDVAYAPALLLVALSAPAGLLQRCRSAGLAGAFALLMLVHLFFQSRGAYVNVAIPPYRSLPAAPGGAPLDAVVSAGGGEADRVVVEEHIAGRSRTISARALRAFVNDGAATLAATAVRIDERGLLRDARGNFLLGPATDAELRLISAHLGAAGAWRVSRLAPQVDLRRRGEGWVYAGRHRLHQINVSSSGR